ncbi:LON peptidase substrate-binding domain-containing protein [Agriterribacter sp.]|uniref:LON peptidase substrate-binding domain-containing protein n=1 Tax=Agriterribacter sp. TaxID=2821509 RepID=UPI002C2840B5|nr:LON peptidase substrate-binding domain-containing protein [Agriterribacter sp.]HRO44496.1 LON peptidase substrate-binding domain-containing protein [Agriterribacter sp.]HRQ16478.1 LON peptidase substrate-binding domain-containing protein [Agriterribacter sp.]
MTNFIPIFPLSIVVFPGEEVNLHIFEPRYKQLIKECFSDVKPFGIPPIINSRMGDLGTLVKVQELVKIYDNGEMDIRIKGTAVFRILELIKRIPDKLYSGAIVNYPETNETGSETLMKKVLKSMREMHRLLKITKQFRLPDERLKAFDIAHHAGLSVEEEQELLGLTQEIHRQEYLKRHLHTIISVLKETETLKERIKLNGHFKNPGSMDL